MGVMGYAEYRSSVVSLASLGTETLNTRGAQMSKTPPKGGGRKETEGGSRRPRERRGMRPAGLAPV
eukprot:782858-Prorocentrum_minimum.AAC.1